MANDMQRGVVVDAQGYFLAAIQWDAKGLPPELNKPRRGEARVRAEDRKTILTAPEAIADPQPLGRWNRSAKAWDMPSDVVYFYDTRTGAPAGQAKVWPDRPPNLPANIAMTDKAPPVARNKRAVWIGNGWAFPRRVALVDALGVVHSPQLEHPGGAHPDVTVPAGWSKITEAAWPVIDGTGEPVAAGDQKVAGKFVRPEVKPLVE